LVSPGVTRLCNQLLDHTPSPVQSSTDPKNQLAITHPRWLEAVSPTCLHRKRNQDSTPIRFVISGSPPRSTPQAPHDQGSSSGRRFKKEPKLHSRIAQYCLVRLKGTVCYTPHAGARPFKTTPTSSCRGPRFNGPRFPLGRRKPN
jgi:hypothetical protein